MQGKQLKKLEAELWKAADQLRANSKLTASEYSMPVLGLIFLRHAFNRFEKAKVTIEQELPVHPKRGRRPITKKDFEERNAMFLPEQAQFHYLVNLPENIDIGEAIDNAMKLIEDEYDNLKGVLPKNFSIFSKDLLRELLRIFNKEVLQKAEGDLFGKIYEYFLNKFAMTGAQEGGEFFTPMSLVQTIVNVIEPDHGIVFDPACGSAGMFVQTGYFIENEGLRPAEKVTFYGQEKAELNTKLAKMNLAVHGLEGNIQEGNTFYEDKHSLIGNVDFLMANPPFNVDGVDKEKDIVKRDPRLVLENKVIMPKNDNANYLWILYFYNYLKPTGRAGFVMASSASDAGHSEKDIREKLVKTGAVDVMMAIGNNFFYTRSLPCTLWFFDRGKSLTLDPSPLGEGLVTVETQIPAQLLANAKKLRKNQTEAEDLLWQLLRNRQLNNLKFRRQHPLKVGFILDFYCAEAKLGIEIDGGYHSRTEQKEYDETRTKIINEYGIRIIRFVNEQVLQNTEQVLKDIVSASSPFSNRRGAGVRTKDTVLMLDARKIYRKVTSKVNDFSPEQLDNLICIVNLYRGNTEKFSDTVNRYRHNSEDYAQKAAKVMKDVQSHVKKILKTLSSFTLKQDSQSMKIDKIIPEWHTLHKEAESIFALQTTLIDTVKNNKNHRFIAEIALQTKALRKPQDTFVKQIFDAINGAIKQYQLGKNKEWKELQIKELLEQLKALHMDLAGNPDEEEPGLLHETEYFYKQALWLTSRFPDGVYTDVEGLCKVVNQKEIEAKDWSLSPGRYVGVDTATDEDFDYEARLADIHIELEGLNEEAAQLAQTIMNNYKKIAL
jgi:type I restriction-modification system DNA methylase subunit